MLTHGSGGARGRSHEPSSHFLNAAGPIAPGRRSGSMRARAPRQPPAAHRTWYVMTNGGGHGRGQGLLVEFPARLSSANPSDAQFCPSAWRSSGKSIHGPARDAARLGPPGLLLADRRSARAPARLSPGRSLDQVLCLATTERPLYLVARRVRAVPISTPNLNILCYSDGSEQVGRLQGGECDPLPSECPPFSTRRTKTTLARN